MDEEKTEPKPAVETTKTHATAVSRSIKIKIAPAINQTTALRILVVLLLLGAAWGILSSSSLSQQVSELEKKLGDLSAKSQLLSQKSFLNFTDELMTKKYVLSKEGLEFSGAKKFSSEYDKYEVERLTPTIVFNCQYKREGTYAAKDPEMEYLSLLGAYYEATGKGRLSEDDARRLNDWETNNSVKINLETLATAKCEDKIEVFYSPTCPFCSSQYPQLLRLVGNVRLEFVCRPVHEEDGELCKILSGLGTAPFSAADVMNKTDWNACQLSSGLSLLKNYGLAETQ